MDNKLNTIIKAAALLVLLAVIFCAAVVSCAVRPSEHNSEETDIAEAENNMPAEKKIIVLDAGHGKPSGQMTDEEKAAEGFVYNAGKKSWGEWRHYKNGTFGVSCEGEGCTHTAPPNGSCWYPMFNGDRSTEPEINLNNALTAKAHLEEMGYEVRMTRTTNDENPSMNKRVSYCFPNNDITQPPDADLYICIHSNAAGGRGTSYISLEGEYKQALIPEDYVTASNAAGELINEKIAAASGLKLNPPIGNEGYLILFNKSPIPIAYLEIGFYDDAEDLKVLEENADAIGRAIAEGADEYLRNR